MLSKGELETFFLVYWNEELFEEGEVAGLPDSKQAEDMYRQAKARLYRKLNGEEQGLLDEMLSAMERMEMYHNIHYLRRGYLVGNEVGRLGKDPFKNFS